MKLTLKIIAASMLLLILLAALAVWKPVSASKIIWPIVEDRMLKEPFRGVTTDGNVESGLFRIETTGVSTRGVVQAARHFIEVLSEAHRSRLLYPVDDLEWRRWANIHISTRQGVGLLEMDEVQGDAAMALLASGLSERGFATARDIMRLEGHLADLMDDHDQYGEGRYWFTLMGEPSETEPWGWQLDGHHLIVNFFVLGDQVVMTPTFMGSEPPRATTGRFAGISVLEDEQELGLSFMNSLDKSMQAKATVDGTKASNNNRGELFQDNAVVPYQGLNLSELTPAQSTKALELIRLYIDHIRPGHAEVKLAEIVRHWNDTWFSWVGETGPDSVFYYRFHSPVVMIEFDHQMPVALDGPDLPTRDHVHTVVRTPNGNDYGRDLLRQHLETHRH